MMTRCLIAIAFLISLSIVSPARAQGGLSLPAGFHAGIYAEGLSGPTAIAFGPDERLYVAQENGAVRRIAPNGIATVASGFNSPLGLAWHNRKLYVSFRGGIAVLTPSQGYGKFTTKVIVSGLPVGRHQNDGLAFRGGWMYVGVGSTCNACVEGDPRSATIMRFHLDGSYGQIFARGLRNPYGLAIYKGKLYATDNGRDDFGDSVPDELNLIVRGGNYGWPNCWGRGGGSGCAGTRYPVANLPPHASADGLAFYTGRSFPARYRGDAFIAEYGDTINSLGTGHVVQVVHFSGGRGTVSTFASGFSNPLAVTVSKGGALLVADFGTGIIWHIQRNGY
ncbi:MAG TPA: PQQ-dependent sugar dehydrogenase [Chloroflexota bacterium]|nr:PQQ-dependent sugar dehydrogenase [Chloroflexota bacterium]